MVAKGLRHTEQRSLTLATPATTAMRRTINAAPAVVPTIPPRPQGNLDTAAAKAITDIVDRIWPRRQARSSVRREGLEWLLSYFASHRGSNVAGALAGVGSERRVLQGTGIDDRE